MSNLRLIVPETDNNKYQHQRLQAIRSAATVFAEKGFHGSSTKDIAERMGIKQGSLYYYFKSKEEALGEVCLFGISDYVDRMNGIAASDQPFEAKLMATITSHLSSYREKNEALKVYNDERLYLPAAKRTTLKSMGSGYRQLLEKIFEEAACCVTPLIAISQHRLLSEFVMHGGTSLSAIRMSICSTSFRNVRICYCTDFVNDARNNAPAMKTMSPGI